MKNGWMWLLLLTGCPAIAQPLTQMLKGRVVDSQSKAPLAGATVTVVNTSVPLGTVTDADGRYYLPGVPLGRQEIRCSYVGYSEQTVPNVMLTAGKETVLDIESSEEIKALQEVSVSGFADRSALDRQYATVSSRQFNAEETRRFAGSRNDPSRMAANYAGVVVASDARNDIIIRGNSPAGLLWRLEGIDIPNPNHFGSLSSTGGPVSMVNNNVLDKSTFLTGAFPAMYGNAVSGVFDLQFRAGNADKREYVGQIGFNGFELGAEGPFKRGNRASYLINYRYSTPAVLQGLGFNFGTGSAVPYYQDLSMKLDFPTLRAGHFSVFALGGSSHIDFKGSAQDTTNFYSDPYTNLYSQTRSGVVGASHTYHWNRTTYTKLTVAASGIQTGVLQDSLTDDRRPVPQFRDYSAQTKLTAHLTLNRKIDSRNTLVLGLMANQIAARLIDSVLTNARFQTIRNFAGQTQFYQLYAHYQHRFSDKLIVNAGFYSQTLSLNGRRSAEPRLNLRYALSDADVLTMGLGRHSQMQPINVYVNRTTNPDTPAEPNRNLDFTYSNQAVVGYERRLAPSWRLKLESYYQAISNVPVDRVSSSYSMLNAGASFTPTSRTSLVNRGLGRNYGLDLTLERVYTSGYYFLGTASLFNSQYQGSDGIWRSTAFANNYVANLLTGKEIRLGEKNTLAIDLRVTGVGGKPYTPLDIEASRQQHMEVDNSALAFTERAKAYFRTDLKLTYRRNTARVMQEWFVDFQNLFNTKNVYAFQYDARHNRLSTVYQMGFYPNLNWRIQF